MGRRLDCFEKDSAELFRSGFFLNGNLTEPVEREKRFGVESTVVGSGIQNGTSNKKFLGHVCWQCDW